MSDPICLLMGKVQPDVVRGDGPLAQMMRNDALHSVFQPIADLKDGSIYGHEALIRGPRESTLHSADALLQAAQDEGLLHELEFFCLFTALKQWGQLKQPGRLFLNISANALVSLVEQGGCTCFSKCVRDLGVSPRMVVLEITEHERVTDMQTL